MRNRVGLLGPFEYTHGRTMDGTVAHERMRAKLLMHYDVQSRTG
jgi:hypothetical protein